MYMGFGLSFWLLSESTRFAAWEDHESGADFVGKRLNTLYAESVSEAEHFE